MGQICILLFSSFLPLQSNCLSGDASFVYESRNGTLSKVTERTHSGEVLLYSLALLQYRDHIMQHLISEVLGR